MLDKNNIYNIDCIEGIKLIDNESVQTIWTDPPYNINYDYKGQYNDKRNNYYLWCEEWIKECYRILKSNGSIFIKMWSLNMPKICEILEKTGFKLKNIIVWKRHSQAGYKDRFLGGYETIIFYTKTDNNKFYPDRVLEKTKFTSRWDDKKEYKGRLHDLWIDIKPIFSGSLKHREGVYKEGTGEKLHPAQHPIALVSRCIISSTDKDDVVVDLFMGSGTTAVACSQLGRNFIGFEISQYYCNLAKKRLAQSKLECNYD